MLFPSSEWNKLSNKNFALEGVRQTRNNYQKNDEAKIKQTN